VVRVRAGSSSIVSHPSSRPRRQQFVENRGNSGPIEDGLRQVSRGPERRRVVSGALQRKQLTRRRLRIHRDPRIEPHEGGT
jgi:hypothetical protein